MKMMLRAEHISHITYHSIVGVGFPSALQLRVAGSCFLTTTLSGCSVIRGGRNCAANKENKL